MFSIHLQFQLQLTFWAFMLILIYPLASMKKLDFLHWTSYITIMVVVYILIMTIVYFASGEFHPLPPVAFRVPSAKSMTTFPLFQNAYCCHYQIANIYRDLKQKSEGKMRKVIALTTTIVFTLYVLVALFGYFTFTQQLELNSNLLNVFNKLAGNLWYIQASNYLMLVAMIAHYPLPCFGLRRTVEALFWKDVDAPTLWRFAICLIIIAVTGIIGSFVDNISDVLGYTSSLAGSCVVFIFPSIFSFMVWKRKGGKLRLAGSIVGGFVGLFVMITGLVCSIIAGTTGH
uniref:Amino acid transporter family protein n=1 Tax=Trepomonas sp. PC1 TaxID=1076344 RepID=A0A146K8S4_9EUKA|eukprot:JAP92175.1 Amino acid transporter family protein [Trepomonas sp. PC1]